MWDEAGLEVDDRLCTALVDDIIHPEGVVRESAAKALSATLQQHPDFVSAILQQLLELYEEKLYVSLIPGFVGHFLTATKQLYEWFNPSVCPSIRPSVGHNFFNTLPSSYHHEIFRIYYH